MRIPIRSLLVPACVTVSLFWIGCGEGPDEGPETVEFRGRVEFTKGGLVKNLADTSVAVQFESIDQPGTQAFGAIMEDGSFVMATQAGPEGKLGVVPGKHRVRLNADDSGARFVARKFLSYETSGITVKAPSEGEVVIEVWK